MAADAIKLKARAFEWDSDDQVYHDSTGSYSVCADRPYCLDVIGAYNAGYRICLMNRRARQYTKARVRYALCDITSDGIWLFDDLETLLTEYDQMIAEAAETAD